MTQCQRSECRSSRILTIRARAKDMHSYSMKEMEAFQMYAMIFSSDGDTTEITLCLECGQVQGEFPYPETYFEGLVT